MGIREAEEATGISRQNIRFYEKQGISCGSSRSDCFANWGCR